MVSIPPIKNGDELWMVALDVPHISTLFFGAIFWDPPTEHPHLHRILQHRSAILWISHMQG
jgi:hypothetical protein